MVPMNEKITIDQIEKMLWEVTRHKIDQSQADAFKVLVETLALERSGVWKKAPTPVVEAHMETLITLARQLLDTGGRMRLHPEGQLDVAENPVATRKDMEALGRRIIDMDQSLQALAAQPMPEVFNPAVLQMVRTFGVTPSQVEELPKWEADLIMEQAEAAAEITRMTQGWDDVPVLDEVTRDEVTQVLVAPPKKRQPAVDLNPDGTLTCLNCGEAKETSEYFRNKKSRTGFETRCRTCRSSKAA